MQEHHSASTVARIVTVLGVVSLIGLAVFGVCFWWSCFTPIYWQGDFFHFGSGPHCFVLPEPKLFLLINDGGDEETFDSIFTYSSTGFDVNDSRFSRGKKSSGVISVFIDENNGTTKIQSLEYLNSKIIMKFYDGKCVMVVSHRGTKLTLADGRELTLDGRTPRWLRCKSDGTIVELEELPAGFVEFFESPPPDPGFIGEVKSWPEAFRK